MRFERKLPKARPTAPHKGEARGAAERIFVELMTSDCEFQTSIETKDLNAAPNFSCKTKTDMEPRGWYPLRKVGVNALRGLQPIDEGLVTGWVSGFRFRVSG